MLDAHSLLIRTSSHIPGPTWRGKISEAQCSQWP